ncbi:MAG: hypothetical protein JXA37_14795, partial [Chloroflexia bacterium]|nr:hypothetical protein [Chloroflexia bacterium]
MQFPDSFWPALSLLLAILWLWTLWQYRRPARIARVPAPESAHWPLEPEDVLKAAYTLQQTGQDWNGQALARSAGVPQELAGTLAEALFAYGWVKGDAQAGLQLTETGEEHAHYLIRAHRIWEQYLVEREGMPLEAVHAEAHRREHETTPEELQRMDAELGHPAGDPHGHPIPAPGKCAPAPQGQPLLE